MREGHATGTDLLLAFAMLIYIGGVCGVASIGDSSWGREWRALVWPAYIASVEVRKFFEAQGVK